VKSKLERRFPGSTVIQWDASRKASAGGSDEASTVSMNDINELLQQEPTTHTFILLKNMFYAAKTVEDKYVGVFWDRVGSKDDTNLQSLLGRACGYNKSKDTIVYCSKQTVENYVSFWKELCSNPDFPPELAVPLARVDRKMAGIRANPHVGAGCSLAASSNHASPLSSVGAGSGAAPGNGRARMVANEDEFECEWREFNTLEEARAWGGNTVRSTFKTDENGFILSSAATKLKKLRYEEIMRLKGGKKTGNMAWENLKVGGRPGIRLYVGYRDENDITSVVYVVRRLTKIA